MFQNIKRENDVEAIRLRSSRQCSFGGDELNGQITLRGPRPGKPHGFTFHIVVDGTVRAGGFQQKLAVAGPVVETRAAGALKHIQVGANALVLKVVAGEREQIQL
jgi:hypothetical protein